MKTLIDKSKYKKLDVLLPEMGIAEVCFGGKCCAESLKEFYLPLVVNSPTEQSPWFINIKNLPIDNEEDIVESLLNAVEIYPECVFVFSNFVSEQENIKDIKSEILSCETNKLIFRIDDKAHNALYAIYSGIRNSLSHGGIVFRNNKVILFSVRQGKKTCFEKSISFYIEIDKVEKLGFFIKTLEKISPDNR